MKAIALSALLLAFCVCVYAQQWCFSNDCPETKATVFSPNIQVQSIFRPAPVLPPYAPVLPLKFSPSTRQFFLNVHPLSGFEDNLRMPGASNVASIGRGAVGAAIGINGGTGVQGARPASPGFSTGQIGFTPHH